MEDRLRVLMFEAAAGDGDPAVEMLQRAGVQFGLRRVATAADAATQICRFNPQLAVAVLTRPDANGCAVLQAMHAKRPDVPVIILSATRSAEHVVQMLKAGATDYVLSDNLERLPSAMLNAVQEAEERVRRAAKVARLECVRAIQSRISSAVLRIHD